MTSSPSSPLEKYPLGVRSGGVGDSSSPEDGNNGADTFVVQRGRTVPTLASIHADNNKEQLNQDTKSEERGESEPDGAAAAAEDTARRSSTVFDRMRNIPVAGRPSDAGLAASAGSRRSSSSAIARRNSISENTSQLSLENLGGSQDNLHLLGRNPDKEMKAHSGRRPDDNRYPVDNRDLEEMEKHAREASPYSGKEDPVNNSSPGVSASEKVSFADLRKQKARDQFHSSGINITYNTGERDENRRTSMPRSNSAQRTGGWQQQEEASESGSNPGEKSGSRSTYFQRSPQ